MTGWLLQRVLHNQQQLVATCTKMGGLGIIFVMKEDIKELRHLAMKPFGHEAMLGRLRDRMRPNPNLLIWFKIF